MSFLKIQDVSELAGATKDNIHHWHSFGYVVPSHKPRCGKARQYTAVEALEVMLFATLCRLGFTRPAAAQLIEDVGGEIRAPTTMVGVRVGDISLRIAMGDMQKRVALRLKEKTK